MRGIYWGIGARLVSCVGILPHYNQLQQKLFSRVSGWGGCGVGGGGMVPMPLPYAQVCTGLFMYAYIHSRVIFALYPLLSLVFQRSSRFVLLFLK